MTLTVTTVSHVISAASQTTQLTPRQQVERALNEVLAEERRASAPEDLVQPVLQVNSVMRAFGVEFELHDDANRTIIRLVDRDTGEVIRQIPPDEMITIVERLEEIRGVLLELQV